MSPQLYIASGLVGLITILWVKLASNLRLWQMELPVNHKREWMIMAICALPSITCFTLAAPEYWYLSGPVSALWSAWFIWNLFDGFYNLPRKKGWWYTGTDDPDDAKTDDFLQSLTLGEHKAVKLLPLAVFTAEYLILILQH